MSGVGFGKKWGTYGVLAGGALGGLAGATYGWAKKQY